MAALGRAPPGSPGKGPGDASSRRAESSPRSWGNGGPAIRGTIGHGREWEYARHPRIPNSGSFRGTPVNPRPAQDALLAALRRGMCGGREAGDHEANAEAAKAQCGSAACAQCRSVSCHSVTRADPMPAEGASPPPPHSCEADVELCGVSTSGVCIVRGAAMPRL